MSIKNEKELQLIVIDRLKELDYPVDSIIPDYRIDNVRADIVIFDNESDIPIAIIECKAINNVHSVEASIGQLRYIYEKFNYPVHTFAAVFKEGVNYDIYDFTDRIRDNTIAIDDCLLEDFPNYTTLKKENKSKLFSVRKKRKKQYIDGLRKVCWRYIPIGMLIVLIFDGIGLYSLNIERLVAFGIIILSLLVPFFGEIKFGDLTLTNKKEKD